MNDVRNFVFRTIRFPAILIYSILAFAWLYLVYLRLHNWWILQKMKIQSEVLDLQSSHNHDYNTHDKNPIIFNAKGDTKNDKHIEDINVISLLLGLITCTVLTFWVALMIVYVPKAVDFSEHYFLFYIIHFTCSVIIPSLFFITHQKSFRDSMSEAKDMLF